MYDRFQLEVAKHANKFVKVILDKDKLDELEVLAKNLVKQKMKEEGYRIDNEACMKRFMTGLKGEAALEKLLGMEIINWTVGDSSAYNVPDIPGYNVGIKAVECGKFPVITKKNYYPQIICIVTPVAVLVCGLAYVEDLNAYQDDNLIQDPYLRNKGTKTCFTGFDKLQQVNSIEDLKVYKK